jgi:hypothetical protein
MRKYKNEFERSKMAMNEMSDTEQDNDLIVHLKIKR